MQPRKQTTIRRRDQGAAAPVFGGYFGIDCEIRLAAADGSGTIYLTDNASIDLFGGWFPDGRALLAVVNPYGDAVMDEFGVLSKDIFASFVFYSENDEGVILYEGTPTTTGCGLRQILTRNDFFPDTRSAPTWSPDGGRILVSGSMSETSFEAIVSDLFFILNVGAVTQRITDTGDFAEANPSISPNGRYIAAVISQSRLEVIDLRDNVRQTVYQGEVQNLYAPAFSPDSQWLAFQTSNKLAVIDIRGDNFTLIEDPEHAGRYEWQPAH